MAAIVRFNPSGDIDAVNGNGPGGHYTAEAVVPYTADTSYHFKLTVNPVAHTYSVVVTPHGGAAVTLATNYLFRTDQARLSTFNNWAIHSDAGSQVVCNVAVAPALVSIHEVPCTVTVNGVQETGTCSGTFTPASSETASLNAASLTGAKSNGTPDGILVVLSTLLLGLVVRRRIYKATV